MPYNGSSPPIFQHHSKKVAVARRPSAGARSSGRPCKYGPRGADGYCPKKPTSAGGGRPCKYGPRGADGYCPKKPRSTSGTTGSTAPARTTPAQQRRQQERVARDAIDLGVTVTQLAIPHQQRLRTLFNSRVTRRGAGALTLGGVAGLAIAAGLAAFAGTTAVLSGIRNRQERIAEEQRLAALGYRVARADMERRLGRTMTRPEHDLLAAAWRDKLPKAR